ncbi:hypothetical protein BEN47_10425 [Hymenobacter lapidarius]|uniref:DUF2141 domain-containing protein n=1 Tax=Hymenobacter lapidarius TaxID=1908237 RepID=A0A1G1T989_9BACT|nr:DUF2141 domain-containing protein [Hymenobacter lapidarius]OGX87450.1 hypothetical protein BEN47_10425 [Hymenobacter lapidarius]
MLPFAALLSGAALLGTIVLGAADTAPVTVVVSSLASITSTVRLYLYNTREGFLKSGKREFTLPVDLPKGEWAVAITQDLNNNDKIDKNFIGISTEPYAFSNNVRPTVAAPGFSECKFTVSGPGKVVSIVLKD